MNEPLIIGISSRALFDLDQSHQLFEQKGLESYEAYQREHEDVPLPPGPAFNLVRKFLALNEMSKQPLVEIFLLSRNTVDTGLRIFNSVQHHNLNITRAVFSGGVSPYIYAKAFGAHLYLSMNPTDVAQAISMGCAAGRLWPSVIDRPFEKELRIAFDGDSVLFSDEAQRIYTEQGMQHFNANERAKAHLPLQEGPFKRLLAALHQLQKLGATQIRTALITARSAPAHERVIHTLRQWEISVDEVFFLGGNCKTDFLTAFDADIFFDDHPDNCEAAAGSVTTAHVPYGVLNGG